MSEPHHCKGFNCCPTCQERTVACVDMSMVLCWIASGVCESPVDLAMAQIEKLKSAGLAPGGGPEEWRQLGRELEARFAL